MASPSSAYPRDLAVRVLTRVLSDREPLDEALAAISGTVSPAARAWLQEVCSGTLRWKGRLDQVIDSVALKKKPSGWLRKQLLVAAYQLVVQERTLPAAVVSETVAEVKRREGEAPSRFANACLRKVAEHGRQWRDQQLAEGAGLEEAAAWASLPAWLWKRIRAQHGADWAREFAQACLERPPIWIRVKPGQPVPSWAEAGPVEGSARALEGGALPEKEGFAQGSFFVQDISSQFLVQEISRKVREAVNGIPRALDLCAAPGGKAAGLAWNGFEVTATDREESKGASRMALLRQTLERVAPSGRVIGRQEVQSALEEQDLVWVDAPCTGTGIIRRHPDVRWLRQERELEGLNRVQLELLKDGWAKVRPGGFLAYSVCSVLQEEGPGLLKKARESKLIDGATVAEWLLAPQSGHRGDGFWATLIRRQS